MTKRCNARDFKVQTTSLYLVNVVSTVPTSQLNNRIARKPAGVYLRVNLYTCTFIRVDVRSLHPPQSLSWISFHTTIHLQREGAYYGDFIILCSYLFAPAGPH